MPGSSFISFSVQWESTSPTSQFLPLMLYTTGTNAKWLSSAVLAHSLLVEGEKTTAAVDPCSSERAQSDELSRTGIPGWKAVLTGRRETGRDRWHLLLFWEIEQWNAELIATVCDLLKTCFAKHSVEMKVIQKKQEGRKNCDECRYAWRRDQIKKLTLHLQPHCHHQVCHICVYFYLVL